MPVDSSSAAGGGTDQARGLRDLLSRLTRRHLPRAFAAWRRFVFDARREHDQARIQELEEDLAEARAVAAAAARFDDGGPASRAPAVAPAAPGDAGRLSAGGGDSHSRDSSVKAPFEKGLTELVTGGVRYDVMKSCHENLETFTGKVSTRL